MNVKQAIIWRHDLNCRLGKKMAQAGHAALADISKAVREHMDENGNVAFTMTPEQISWYLGDYRKIVLRANDESELLLLHQFAKERGLPCELIVDIGLTEWDKPTTTCLSIGPAEDARIDEVTGERGPLGRLKLL